MIVSQIPQGLIRATQSLVKAIFSFTNTQLKREQAGERRKPIWLTIKEEIQRSLSQLLPPIYIKIRIIFIQQKNRSQSAITLMIRKQYAINIRKILLMLFRTKWLTEIFLARRLKNPFIIIQIF